MLRAVKAKKPEDIAAFSARRKSCECVCGKPAVPGAFYLDSVAVLEEMPCSSFFDSKMLDTQKPTNK